MHQKSLDKWVPQFMQSSFAYVILEPLDFKIISLAIEKIILKYLVKKKVKCEYGTNHSMAVFLFICMFRFYLGMPTQASQVLYATPDVLIF